MSSLHLFNQNNNHNVPNSPTTSIQLESNNNLTEVNNNSNNTNNDNENQIANQLQSDKEHKSSFDDEKDNVDPKLIANKNNNGTLLSGPPPGLLGANKMISPEMEPTKIDIDMEMKDMTNMNANGTKNEDDDKSERFLDLLDNIDTNDIFNEIVNHKRDYEFPTNVAGIFVSYAWDHTIEHDGSSWDSFFKRIRNNHNNNN